MTCVQQGRSVRLVRGLKTTIVAIALVLGACGGDVAPLQAAVDGLQLPGSWQTAKTFVKGGPSPCVDFDDAYCPSVTRYYTSEDSLPDLFEQIKQAVGAEGFEKLKEFHPDCDFNTNGAPCSLDAQKGDLLIGVDLFPPGQDVDHAGVAQPGHATVRVIVRQR